MVHVSVTTRPLEIGPRSSPVAHSVINVGKVNGKEGGVKLPYASALRYQETHFDEIRVH